MRTSFNNLKNSLSEATLLAFPDNSKELSLQTDTSNRAIGAVIQQKVGDHWQPLSFLSRKLSKSQVKHSTYDRELLAIYLAIKHFKHWLEGRKFHILIDHKPLIFAFFQKIDNSSPRQCHQLNLISKFFADNRHVAGEDNVVPDTLSRTDSISMPVLVTPDELAAEQALDNELPFIKKS